MSAPQPSLDEARLRRDLGSWLATAVTVNAMVGTGIFRLAPTIVRLSGSLERALWAWLAGGLISLCGALCMAELATRMPRAGGIYEYLRRAYGPTIAFWYGWTRLWLLGPSAAGSFARLAAESLAACLGWAQDDTRDTTVACSVLLVCTLVNLRSVRAASSGQAVLTAIKLAGLLVLALACLVAEAHPSETSSDLLTPPTWSGLCAALVSVMWAYDGWADVASLSGETRAPARTLPRAFLAGTLAVTLAYVLVNLGYARVLGSAGLVASTSGSDMVAMNAAAGAFGAHGRRALSALVFTSCVGACTVGVLTGSRVFVSMASDRLILRALGKVSPRTGAPLRAVLLTAVLGMTYLSVRSFEQLTNAFVAGMFPFYMLAIVAVGLVRQRAADGAPSDDARPFRTPLYPLVAGLFLAGALALLYGAAADVTTMTYVACAVMLAGLPIGWLVQRRARTAPAI